MSFVFELVVVGVLEIGSIILFKLRKGGGGEEEGTCNGEKSNSEQGTRIVILRPWSKAPTSSY